MVALKILDDKVPDRLGASRNAKRYYISIMQLQGQAQQALDKMEEYFPGVNEYVKTEDDWSPIFNKILLMPLHKELSSAETFCRRYDEFVRVMDEKDYPWRSDPGDLMFFSLLEDDIETALSAALEALDGYSTMDEGWRRFETYPLYSQLLDEPEIVSRIAQFKSKEIRFRKEIETMLQEPEWAL